jgi:hypothetical protein
VTIQHLGLTSFVKWQTLGFFILGILAGILYTAWFAITGQITGWTIVWYFPMTCVVYAIMGVICSTLLGVIYNSIAGKIGGMQFDIVTHNNPVPPLPPARWEGTLPKIENPESLERA